MPCILLLLVLAFPRVMLVLMVLLSSRYWSWANHNLLLAVLGFLFLPLTTIVYAWEVTSHIAMAGVNLLFLIIAVIIDVGGLGHGYSRRGGW
jgi:hypothetical protein